MTGKGIYLQITLHPKRVKRLWNDSESNDDNPTSSIESENNNKNFIVFTISLPSFSKIKSLFKSSDEEGREFDIKRNNVS